MATACIGVHTIDQMKTNLRNIDIMKEKFMTAARLMDEKKARVKTIKYTAVGSMAAAAVLGGIGAVFTGGASAAAMGGLAVGGVALVFILLAQVVELIMKNDAIRNVELEWDAVKKTYTRDRGIPRENKARIAEWARQELSDDGAKAVIAAIEKSTSGSSSTERLKLLNSTDVRRLLDSLVYLVSADFSIFEILVAALKEKDEPGDVFRYLARQMEDYKAELRSQIDAAKEQEEKQRQYERAELATKKEKRKEEEQKEQERKEQKRKEREKIEREDRERRQEDQKKKEQELARTNREERKQRRENDRRSFLLEFILPAPGATDSSVDAATRTPDTPATPDEPKGPPQSEIARPTQSPIDLRKSLRVSETNLLTSYTATHAVQTDAETVPSTSPPAFCSAWEISGSFNGDGGILQKPKSDVMLTIPPGAIPRHSNLRVRMSVCVDVERIHKSLNLPEGAFVASPLVEISAGADFRFLRPVQITLPHCLDPNVDPSKVAVYRATKNNDGETTLCEVNHGQRWEFKTSNLEFPTGQQLRASSDQKVAAAYFVSEDGRLVISTDCFSGYVVCAHCQHKSTGCPTLLLAGAGTNEFKDGTSLQTASVQVHIWDERLTIRDFLENIKHRVTDVKHLTLFKVDKKSHRTLSARLDVIGGNVTSWRHCVTRDGRIGHPEEQSFDLRQCLGCSNPVGCRANRQPEVVDWALETVDTSETALSLRCVLAVTHIPGREQKRLAIKLEEPSHVWGMGRLRTEAERLGVSVSKRRCPEDSLDGLSIGNASMISSGTSLASDDDDEED